ncbi:HesB/YadR/YfhF family protein [Metabacillus sp. KIGAM252]|uniref:HesB/YadR/YfhF family protein n=1 Tax=Metabacillus flavus TaxID=2823519 RepID=A0ABS5LEE2_9BACI|nr:HesB/YadR/YfhF family protein [Metabacillus flavus]MBS2969118.1 HesB/YadR/YfhF family protein [Metabacillus flavus]
MKIKVNEEAAKWYQDELHLQAGDSVRFFVRYGGSSTIQKGFSLGVAKEGKEDAGASIEAEGIDFFVSERDLWYFDGNDLLVEFDPDRQEPIFDYKQAAD